MSFYKVMYSIFNVPLRLLYRIHAHGEENMPRDRGCLICCNHTSRADTIAIAAGLKCRPCFMAKKEIFKIPLLRLLFKGLGAFPVDRGGADVGAIKKATSIVKDGGLLAVFPQGTRRKFVDPRTTPVKGGAGLIAYRTGVDVVPVYIKTAKNHVAPFRRTDIYCGKPIKFEELGFTDGGRAEYQAATEYIFDKICALGEGSTDEQV